jgi:hypothetical protein
MSETPPAGADPAEWRRAFAAVADQMYAVLAACPRRALLACSTVNPRHPLPVDHQDLVREALTSSPQGPPITFGRRFAALGKLAAIAAREVVRIAAVRLLCRAQLSSIYRQPAAVVIKTWFYGAPKEDGPDFYLGQLPQMLRARGVSCVLIGGDAGYGPTLPFARGLLRSGRRAVPELALVPWWAPISTFIDQMRASLALSRLARAPRAPLFCAVAARASLECLTGATFKHALHFYVARRAVAIWQPKVYGTLYEGQPWEKVAWLGAKSANASCRTMGFQHTVVMPHSWGLIAPHRGGWELAAPDIVLGLGRTTVDMMVRAHEGLGTTFVALGSFRRAPDSNDAASTDPAPSRQTVLVVPEGFMEEAQLLFQRAAEAAIAAPDQRFIFRCHPAWPFDRVLPHLSVDVRTLDNIELSTRPAIADDFARSSIVLYRGSSVVLYGVLAGLKPIYFNEPGRPFVDPLFQLDRWRDSVTSVPELVTALKAYARIDAGRAREAWQPAQRYVDDYSIPVRGEAVDHAAAVMNA